VLVTRDGTPAPAGVRAIADLRGLLPVGAPYSARG
jgi:hypothetical protein